MVGSMLPVGSLVGSRKATLDGRKPLPHTVVLSGDRLRVNDGLAVVTLARGTRIILGRESDVTFWRDGGAVKVSLARGNLALYHPQSGGEFHVNVGDVRITPARNSTTLAELDMSGGVLDITARVGTLSVEVSGTTREVRQGHPLGVNLAAARAAAPGSRAKPNPKRIFSHKVNSKLALLGAGAAAVSSVALTRPRRQSSPTTPTP